MLCDGPRLHSGLDSELPEQVGDVHAGGLIADEQPDRDLPVGAASGQVGQNFALPGGQAVPLSQLCGFRYLRDGSKVQTSPAGKQVGVFDQWFGACGLSRRPGLGDEVRRLLFGAVVVEDGFSVTESCPCRVEHPAYLVELRDRSCPRFGGRGPRRRRCLSRGQCESGRFSRFYRSALLVRSCAFLGFVKEMSRAAGRLRGFVRGAPTGRFRFDVQASSSYVEAVDGVALFPRRAGRLGQFADAPR